MAVRAAIPALLTAGLLALSPLRSLAEAPSAAETSAPPASNDMLVLLSLDVRTMPDFVARKAEPEAPRWRTSFGSERRSEPAKPSAPPAAVDADIVLLQGVTDVPMLRRWFPAGQWRLVVSRQMLLPSTPDGPTETDIKRASVPTTAVAVRLRAGLRMTGQDHLTELADALGQGPSGVTAAGTAVRVLIDGRQTWALSVMLPENCGADCPGRSALKAWHLKREAENIRRVTGGRFEWPNPAPPANETCGSFGLRLDPAPPPPRQAYIPAAKTGLLGCTASVAVAK